MTHTSRHRGFTIIELLVVITIIALIVSLLLPAVTMARATAQSAVCAGQLHQTGVAFFVRLNDYKEVFPIVCPAGGSVGNANSWCFSYPLGQNIEGMGVLAQNGYSAKSLMSCPGHSIHGKAAKLLDDPTLGYPTHAHSDYGVGWHSIIFNEGGLRTPDGTRYDLPYDSWGDNYTNCTPYAPTLTQYSRDWFRSPGTYQGSQALITDVWAKPETFAGNWCGSLGWLGNDYAGDIPHMANINVLCVDGKVKTINQGFNTFGDGGCKYGYQYWDGPWWNKVNGACR